MNQPTSAAHLGTQGYQKYLTYLTSTLAIAIMYNSGTATTSLVAVNLQTGQTSPPLAVSTSNADGCFRLEPLSATSFAVLWISNKAVGATAATNCRIATVNTSTMVTAFAGATATGPATGSTLSELNTLRLSSGVIVAVQAVAGSSAAALISFVITGASITGQSALTVSTGLVQYCANHYSSIYEIAPNVFAIPMAQAGTVGYVVSYNVNTVNGTITLVQQFQWTGPSAFSGAPGTAALANFPGTNYWMVAAQTAPGQNSPVYYHLVSIAAAGAINFVGSASTGNVGSFSYAFGYGQYRFSLQPFAAGQIITAYTNSAGSNVLNYRVFGYNNTIGHPRHRLKG